ncbi:MAG: DegV family protein [Clostridia bacterium]|nr:DegV family protein [Clostridia bacterium]
MYIITDSAADLTNEELHQNNVSCAPMQVMFGEDTFTAGKAISRHRAIDALCKKITSISIDPQFPILPLYTYSMENCRALIKKLREKGVLINEQLSSALGPTLSVHIGPGAYGVAFIENESI